MEEDNQDRPRKRRRPALACENCRKRKVKCDLERPCGPCEKSHVQPCTFVSATRDSGHGNGLGNGIFAVTKPRRLSNAVHRNTTSKSQRSIEVHSPADNLASASAVEDLTARMRVLEERLAKADRLSESSILSPSTGHMHAAESLPSVPGIFNKTRFFGRSHYMYLVFQFEKTFAAILAVDANERTGVRSALTRCKSIAKSIKAFEIAQAQNSMTMHDLKLQIPARGVADRYVEAYMRTFEPIFRVLHVPTFKEEYAKFWAHPGDSKQDGFIIKLLLIMSLGTIFFPEDMQQSKRLLPTQWIFTAQCWLNSPFEKARITLETLQIHCLYLLARQANYVSGDMIWLSSGTLLNTALHMGLQMDPSAFPTLNSSTLESEMKRRLWATILEIIVQSAMDAGGLPGISGTDYNTHVPSNVDDQDFQDLSVWAPYTQIGPPSSRATFCQSSVQVALARSLPTRLEIGRLINGVTSMYNYDDVLRLSGELEHHLQEARSLFAHSGNGAGISRFHQQLYDLLTTRFFLALHWQFAIKARTNARFQLSHSVCLNTSLKILSNYDDPDFRKLCLQGSGPYRVVHSQAACFVTVECMERIQAGPATGLNNVSSVSEMKALVLQHVRDCKERVKLSETNPKASLFFPGLMAQMQALEAGIPLDAAIAAAIQEALAEAETSLQDRLDRLSKPLDAPSKIPTPEILGFDGNLLQWDDNLDFFNDI